MGLNFTKSAHTAPPPPPNFCITTASQIYIVADVNVSVSLAQDFSVLVNLIRKKNNFRLIPLWELNRVSLCSLEVCHERTPRGDCVPRYDFNSSADERPPKSPSACNRLIYVFFTSFKTF